MDVNVAHMNDFVTQKQYSSNLGFIKLILSAIFGAVVFVFLQTHMLKESVIRLEGRMVVLEDNQKQIMATQQQMQQQIQQQIQQMQQQIQQIQQQIQQLTVTLEQVRQTVEKS